MGERVTFPSNGGTCEGFLDRPPGGRGAAVVVIQEWWGLVPHIEDVASRLAREGFLALAPDLYHGKATTSPDEAGRLMMELDVPRAGRDIAGAGTYLLSRPECASKKYGVVGFCMGGALAQWAATHDANVGACASFYGGFQKVAIDWEKLASPVLLIFGGKDRSVPASQAGPLEEKLRKMGKKVETAVYPEAGHAFFNDARPQVYDRAAAEDAWRKTVALFRESLR